MNEQEFVTEILQEIRQELVLATVFARIAARHEDDLPAIEEFLGVGDRWGSFSPIVLEDMFDKLAQCARAAQGRHTC